MKEQNSRDSREDKCFVKFNCHRLHLKKISGKGNSTSYHTKNWHLCVQSSVLVRQKEGYRFVKNKVTGSEKTKLQVRQEHSLQTAHFETAKQVTIISVIALTNTESVRPARQPSIVFYNTAVDWHWPI